MYQKCYKFTVSGTVQGVGFRYFTTMKANELGLLGYVKNLSNGDVEVLASGDKREMEAFECWLEKGPRLANVSKLKKEEADSFSFTDFQIT
ncbi:acylphosphatase [Vibrio sp. ZSDE26]|uniref:Acylphosphatase n=1 Tax=Vibrio amylolyticus TaxID=2847292 RepID=A0A9X2BJB5_9VIBR|nr:acylphosphatase [Vibrio amylolyticus]MCK6265055.1 acylphosphatase [Vibrio amylolyticus]